MDSNLFSDAGEGPNQITINGESPIISNNVMTDNVLDYMYGYIGGTVIEIKNAENVTVIGNTIGQAMTGILVNPATASGTITIESNILTNNHKEGILLDTPVQLIIKNNTISQNHIGIDVYAFSSRLYFNK